MERKLTLIKFFTLTGNILIPFYAFLLFWSYGKNTIGFIFFLFISIAIIERAWETFKTSKEKKREEMHGDWTLAAVTGTYLLLFFFTITEFYLRVKAVNNWITLMGLLLVALSFRVRFWGMAALGKQWAVHAVGVQKIKKVRLVKLGPYKYVRHPIYLGIIIELIAFPIVANAFFAMMFAFIVCIPLVIIRAHFEEGASYRRFGEKYKTYRNEVGMFFPTQLFNRRF